MPTTIDDIKKFYKERSLNDEVKDALYKFENYLVELRDRGEIPLYLTKARIKDINSVYLKFKRKPNKDGKERKLNDITDYAGLRALCMFEQDILPMHIAIINYLKSKRYELEEFIIINNSDDSNNIDKLNYEIKKVFSKYDIKSPKKDLKPGYKSIHYIVSKKIELNDNEYIYYIEIQLRTLLQDVWGEIEHSIGYKQGSIHPHIKKRFELLSQELSTKDKLLSHLKDISDKENASERLNLRVHSDPSGYFNYEDGLYPEFLCEIEAFKEYNDHMKDRQMKDKGEWLDTASNYIKGISTLLTSEYDLHLDIDEKHKYWFYMEKAFLFFINRDYVEADKLYKQYINSKKYVPHFRRGEIFFIQGSFVDALVEFDKCLFYLDEKLNDESKVTNNYQVTLRNAYKIKSKISYIYWLLGSEYIHNSYKEIKDSINYFKQVIYTKDESEEKYMQEIRNANNVCWYSLDLYSYNKQINNSDNIDFKECEGHFEVLKKLVDDNDSNKYLTLHYFDTIQWFYYNKYDESNEYKYIEKAVEYCEKGVMYGNVALSSTLFRNHAQLIEKLNKK